MKNKKRYKFITGVQQIVSDSPNKSKLYNYQTERAGEDYLINNSLNALSGQYKGIGQIGGMAGDFVKNKVEDKKTGSIVGGALKTGASGAALGAQIGSIIPGVGTGIGAAVGGTAGLIIGGRRGKQEAIESARLEKEAQQEADTTNFNKGFKRDASTNVQQFLKKGKYKVKTKKEPRPVEWEGGTNPDGSKRKNGSEAVFGPKKADGSRDLLYYNPDDPTHEAGGVPGVVVPKEMYNNGTNNLMPRRSKTSLLGSGMMAVGARQVKVNELNNTSLSENLGGMPAVNVANKFVQPMTGKMQVARQIPEYRRKEKQNTPRSHKKVNPDLNKIVDPPTPIELRDPITPSGFNKQSLYETKLPKPRSTFNTKNDFKKGGKYVKVYKDGAKSVSLAFSRGEKDPKGGLTQKGVDKYNRATGGNLKMAVTTPPSKLKPGSKAANRRKSFCARMSGVKGPMEKNGKPTRKALALRKWNC